MEAEAAPLLEASPKMNICHQRHATATSLPDFLCTLLQEHQIFCASRHGKMKICNNLVHFLTFHCQGESKSIVTEMPDSYVMALKEVHIPGCDK